MVQARYQHDDIEERPFRVVTGPPPGTEQVHSIPSVNMLGGQDPNDDDDYDDEDDSGDEMPIGLAQRKKGPTAEEYGSLSSSGDDDEEERKKEEEAKKKDGQAAEAYNLYEQLTSDIPKNVLEEKSDKFEDMKEEMQKVIFGEIGNFYRDDFPNDKLTQGGEESELS